MLSFAMPAPMRHIITVPFYGFRVTQAATSAPTTQEFLQGSKLLLFDGIELTARRITD
ncbi:hypothetical protein [Burkholderia vietnamiensis]|uniref:hypothetical protein n=1 Tax=Burkholderia vietnamiensis TaxID=60552 RepID=UPI0012DB4FA5|nr:hypothetical protein [Burkholderia vietnamiensis]